MLVPLASLLAAEMGHWHVVFLATAAMTAIAAVLAVTLLRPPAAAQTVAAPAD